MPCPFTYFHRSPFAPHLVLRTQTASLHLKVLCGYAFCPLILVPFKMSTSIDISSLPSTMRAWSYSVAGPPSSVLKLSSDFPTPAITTPDDVLIRVSHAALNHGGSFVMQLVPTMIRKTPAIPEWDFAGTVVDSGHSVPEDLKPGTPVFGVVTASRHMKTGGGTLAEYVVCPASLVVRKPINMSFEEAAGLVVAGCTAMQLLDRSGLKPGDSVLVNGGSGGIGVMAVQLARNAVGESGKVVATCSGANVELVKTLGADEVTFFQTQRCSPLHL